MEQTEELKRLHQRSPKLEQTLINHLIRLSERMDRVEKEASADRLRGYPGGE